MHVPCLVSGTQSFWARGWSGGWNLADERWRRSDDPRSFSLSEPLADRVCVGVLSAIEQKGSKAEEKKDQKETS